MQAITVEPLLKDPLNNGHTTFDLSIKDKLCDPYRTVNTCNFTSERGQPMYNSEIIPKLAGPKVSII